MPSVLPLRLFALLWSVLVEVVSLCSSPSAASNGCTHSLTALADLFKGSQVAVQLEHNKKTASISGGGCTNTKNRLKYSFQSVFNAVLVLHFRDDNVSIAKIRLIPITVSQLKCALHILIGDWYKLSAKNNGEVQLLPGTATRGKTMKIKKAFHIRYKCGTLSAWQRVKDSA